MTRKRKKLLFIIVAAVGFHAVILWFLLDLQPLPKEVRVEASNFHVREKAFSDETTGEPLVYREITVSTKLAPAPVPPTAH